MIICASSAMLARTSAQFLMNLCFFWPQKVDACWVLFQKILCKTATPTIITGRSYSTTPTECNAVVNACTDKQTMERQTIVL